MAGLTQPEREAGPPRTEPEGIVQMSALQQHPERNRLGGLDRVDALYGGLVMLLLLAAAAAYAVLATTA
jgi:hypothetical protein